MTWTLPPQVITPISAVGIGRRGISIQRPGAAAAAADIGAGRETFAGMDVMVS